MKTPDLPASVLDRHAIVYVRQSTSVQVQDNLESQRRQYELVDLARACGFRDVATIDDDLGRSASGVVSRPGFETLIAQVAQGIVGAVFCLEPSRLARNGRDWHHLLELCGLVGTRVIDGEGAYDPSVPNDRLLLGLKGTMSEFELTLLRRRLGDAARAKALRGELRLSVPIGYRWTREHGLEMDPDRRVQEAIRLVFSLFERLASARKVLLFMHAQELRFPRPEDGKRTMTLRWERPAYRSVLAVLQNPFYAGAYAYGKSSSRTQLIDGRLARSYGHPRPMEAWAVLLRDHHAGYIAWDAFECNQERLRRNAYGLAAGRPKSARGGRALLTGLLRCARCGRMLSVAYNGRRGRLVRYACRMGNTMHGLRPCITFGAQRPDDAVAGELVRAVEPLTIEAVVMAAQHIEQRDRERVRALELECEQARYEVQLAARRYEVVDPDNRLVAAELETRWNDALGRLRACEERLTSVAGARRIEPDVSALERLAQDLPAVWNAAATDMGVKQRLVRTLVEEIVVDIDEATRDVVLVIHWKGGQHSALRVRKPATGEHTKRTPAAADHVARAMAGTWSDEHIAATLNRMGLRTGQGQTWTQRRVESYRRKAGIAAYAPAANPREWVTMRDAAMHAGVSSHMIRALIQRGLLPAKQVVPDAPWQIRVADLDTDAVRTAIARRHSVPGYPYQARVDDRTLAIPGT